MKLFLWILYGLALFSGAVLGWQAVKIEIDKYGSQVVKPSLYLHILTKKDSITVLEYHGIKHMTWSMAHRDFIFKREGIICRARAFEILKEKK